MSERAARPGQGATRLLTVDEAASIAGISPRTFNDYRLRGEGPKYIKVGGLVRYAEDDLWAWLRSRTVEPGSSVTASGAPRVGRRPGAK